MKYYMHKIDYEYGEAVVVNQTNDPKEVLEDFYEKAGQCFGIRKSIGEVEITSTNEIGSGELTILSHSGGDTIVFDKENNKLVSEWD